MAVAEAKTTFNETGNAKKVSKEEWGAMFRENGLDDDTILNRYERTNSATNNHSNNLTR